MTAGDTTGDEVADAFTDIMLAAASTHAHAPAVEICDPPTHDTMEERCPSDWRSLRAVVLHRDNYRCGICNEEATEVDHVWPKSQGGADKLSNLRALCKRCNASKGDVILLKHITTDRLNDAENAAIREAVAAVRVAARWMTLREILEDRDGGPIPLDDMREASDKSLTIDPEAQALVLDIVRRLAR